MNSYIATATESKQIISGEKTCIVTLVKPLILEDKKLSEYSVSELKKIHAAIFGEIKPPYTPGIPFYVREPWWSGFELDDMDCVDYDKPLTIYRADTKDERPFDVSESYCIHMYGNDKRDWLSWKSASVMPKSAARTWCIPTKVECKRVQDITQDEAESIVECKSVSTLADDFYCYFRNYLGGTNESDWPWFKETDNGALKSFESYIIHKFGQSAWDSNAWVFLTHFKIKTV